jgi:exopolysaccharide biosynthesis polyprenyl glycosylphosphotransferase
LNWVAQRGAGVPDAARAGRANRQDAARPLGQGGRSRRRRGWLVRRALLAADVAGLALAYLLARAVTGSHLTPFAITVLAVAAPLWLVAAKLYGLYERDEEHVDHSTVDEMFGVFHLVTIGSWAYFVAMRVSGYRIVQTNRLVIFWLLATGFVFGLRVLARTLCRRHPLYVQNTLIIGAGDIGQLAARKLLQHPEYKINLLGFVDGHPRPRRTELSQFSLVGDLTLLPELVESRKVDRVIVAFSDAGHEELLALIRALRVYDVQIDLVPRLFEVIGPRAGIHAFEGLALVGLPPMKLSRSSRLLKRALDLVVALVLLVFTAPLFAVVALAIRLDSRGPVLFRQQRLGYDQRPFTILKFRTMRVGTDQEEHRRYIEQTLSADVAPNANGLYKLERPDAITRVGAFLRRTSLDELPQLVNVVAGHMSLVGPRPCLAYETEGFEDHHFERFMVQPGLTGLWQVGARGRSTFGEALDMDVAYVRGWSFSLDLRLLLKTPLSLVRMRAAA